MLITVVTVNGTFVDSIGDIEESVFNALPPGLLYNVSAYPHIRIGWLYDPLTGIFSPNWTMEQADALNLLKDRGRNARSKMVVSGIIHDTSEDAFSRLTARIRAREERGDLATGTEFWRLEGETFVGQSLGDDRALLVAMYEHVQACEDAYQAARVDVLAACAAEDLDALAVAKVPTWPT